MADIVNLSVAIPEKPASATEQRELLADRDTAGGSQCEPVRAETDAAYYAINVDILLEIAEVVIAAFNCKVLIEAPASDQPIGRAVGVNAQSIEVLIRDMISRPTGDA